MSERLRFIQVKGEGEHQSFCAAVDEGLSSTPKSLPTRFFYDEHGSELFEHITELPEYYLTRCETEIFTRHASDLAATVPKVSSLVEFGSGSSKKTRLLIEALIERQGSLRYDISTEFLRSTALTLLSEYPTLTIEAVGGEYFDVAANLPSTGTPRLVLFLGSNIGNLERNDASKFLCILRSQLEGDDRLLMGIDLVKDPAILHAAYNDLQNVTADFNKNLLRRINKELDANFDLASFDHDAPYLEADCRVEMRLVSKRNQSVWIEAIGKSLEFKSGEFIHTEWSHKYTMESFARLCRQCGFKVENAWFDCREWFASVLLSPLEDGKA